MPWSLARLLRRSPGGPLAPPGPEVSPTAPDAPLDGNEPAEAWRRLPAMARVVGPPHLTAATREFVEDLAGRRTPDPILRPLAHDVTADGPAGLVSGLAEPLIRPATVIHAASARALDLRAGPSRARATTVVGSASANRTIADDDDDRIAPIAPMGESPRTLAPVPDEAVEPLRTLTMVGPTPAAAGEGVAGASRREAPRAAGTSLARAVETEPGATRPTPVDADRRPAGSAEGPLIEAIRLHGGIRRLGLGAPLTHRPEGAPPVGIQRATVRSTMGRGHLDLASDAEPRPAARDVPPAIEPFHGAVPRAPQALRVVGLPVQLLGERRGRPTNEEGSLSPVEPGDGTMRREPSPAREEAAGGTETTGEATDGATAGSGRQAGPQRRPLVGSRAAIVTRPLPASRPGDAGAGHPTLVPVDTGVPFPSAMPGLGLAWSIGDGWQGADRTAGPSPGEETPSRDIPSRSPGLVAPEAPRPAWQTVPAPGEGGPGAGLGRPLVRLHGSSPGIDAPSAPRPSASGPSASRPIGLPIGLSMGPAAPLSVQRSPSALLEPVAAAGAGAPGSETVGPPAVGPGPAVSAAAPAPDRVAGTSAEGATAGAPPPLDEEQLDLLARRLYGRLRERLGSELLVDRERAGLLADV
ncbi:MAG: hypothetical protein IVW53_12860 [Chloroflexi bacterium]|nr:hypothetical protein [Chloroflexota bacterium]